MNKPPVIAVVLVAIAIVVVVWLRWPREETGASATAARPAATHASSGTSPSAGKPPASRGEPSQDERPKHVRRLGPAARRQLAQQIAAARARARSPASPGGVGLVGDDTIALEQVSTTVQEALEEAIPMLAECYQQRPAADAGHRTAAVQMTMFSDPEIGTVIDTEAMHDRDGAPLDPELDDCLRTTIESLGLPPLEVGGRLPLEYSFVFD